MQGFRNIGIILLVLFTPSSFAVNATVEDVKSIARLYFVAFDRIPKVDGLNFWVDPYEGGRSVKDIARDFKLSPEFVSKYGPLNDVQYVELLTNDHTVGMVI